MGATLRVDPTRLRDAAQAQYDVSSSVSGLDAGQSMTNAGAGMPGLLTEAACHATGSVFDDETRRLHDELAAHSAKLVAAADLYHQTDEQFGRRLDKQVE